MSLAVISFPVNPPEPSFSNHVTELSWPAEASTSTSASPSTSAAKTKLAPFAELVRTFSAKDWDPSFSYHATVSS